MWRRTWLATQTLIEELRPRMDALFGLALLSLTPEGRAEIDRLAGTPVAAPDGFLTRWSVVEALRAVLDRAGRLRRWS